MKAMFRKENLYMLWIDLGVIAVTFYVSFLLRFGFVFPAEYIPAYKQWLLMLVIIKVASIQYFVDYNIDIKYTGLSTLHNILTASGAVFFVMVMLNIISMYFPAPVRIPFGVIIIDTLLFFLLVSSVRLSKRFYFEILKNKSMGKRTLVVGANKLGERVIRDLLRSDNREYFPFALVDEDRSFLNKKIHNCRMIGTLDDIAQIVSENNIEAAIIAVKKNIPKIYSALSDCGVKNVKMVDDMRSVPEDGNIIKTIQDISLEDLLNRDSVQIDLNRVSSFISGKDVMVTGAGGSIGSEIVRQLIKYAPSKIIAYEIDETELYDLELDIGKQVSQKQIRFVSFLGDVRDNDSLERVFKENSVDIIFHASAYKHVPVLESFPAEAVKTNIIATQSFAQLAVKYGVSKFINISTDKAVNPTSIMGATKRFNELICSAYNSTGETRFVSVRFGNVLGSRGSAVPIFTRQIKKGGPVTVTDKNMQRYFMTIPEAVMLVMQASVMGEGGEVFVLDMGEPVKILKLVEDLIRMNNLVPYEDIDIEFTGLRPGEKLFEELLTAEEGTVSTTHSKIFRAVISTDYSKEQIDGMTEQFRSNINSDKRVIVKLLKEYIPFYEG